MEVEVEYNYEAEQSDELSIKVGDILKNVTISEGGWWEGELNGKKGMFPDNFVKVINKDKDTKKDEGKKKDVQASKRQSVRDLANKLKGQVHEGGPPMLRKKEPAMRKKKAKAVFSYEPENEDELKLEIGDLLDVIKQEEEGWWEGILNGKQGMFPSNFVEIIDESAEAAASENADKFENTEEHVIKGKKIQGVGLGNIFGDGPIKLRSTTGKKPGDKPIEPPKAEKREDPVQRRLKETKAMEKAIVRYSYAAENEDELSLTEGETISILDKELEDSGWWKGELNGRVGVFPDNFVEIIKEEITEKKLNKGPQPPIPAPQPKPKKPPPPTQASVTKPPPKLPEKAPAITEHSKPDPVKEDKPAIQQPTIPAKKPVHPPPPLTKKPIKPIDIINKEEKKEESKTEPVHGFEAVETGSDKLTHLTALRPRGPAKRPPSQVFILNPKTAKVTIEEEERNGDVKEDKPHVVSHHTTSHHTTSHHASHHLSKPDKSEEVSGKPHSVPSRPFERPHEPSPATASLQLAIDELRKEMNDLKHNTVSKTVFNELKSENERLKQDLDSVKSTYSRRMRDIMTEVDEEKKIRLSTQVEIERIRKLVAESHV